MGDTEVQPMRTHRFLVSYCICEPTNTAARAHVKFAAAIGPGADPAQVGTLRRFHAQHLYDSFYIYGAFSL